MPFIHTRFAVLAQDKNLTKPPPTPCVGPHLPFTRLIKTSACSAFVLLFKSATDVLNQIGSDARPVARCFFADEMYRQESNTISISSDKYKGRSDAGSRSTKPRVPTPCDFFVFRKTLPSLTLVAHFCFVDPQTYRQGTGIDIFLISLAIQSFPVGRRKTTFSSCLPGRLASSQYMVCPDDADVHRFSAHLTLSKPRYPTLEQGR